MRILALILAVMLPFFDAAEAEPPCGDALVPTPWVDAYHPEVTRTALSLVAGAEDDVARAVRLHDFVRDGVRFGWTRDFYRMKASQVLEARIGYCNTKATLFIALLRSVGIPARQRFVDLDAQVLRGFVSRQEPFVEHSYTEVWLAGRWVATDSYTVDRPLFERARERLRAEGRGFGYGIHVAGQPDWDGRSDSFVQFVDDGRSRGFTDRDYGVYPDSPSFFDMAPRRDSLRGMARIAIPLLIGGADRKVERLRGASPEGARRPAAALP